MRCAPQNKAALSIGLLSVCLLKVGVAIRRVSQRAAALVNARSGEKRAGKRSLCARTPRSTLAKTSLDSICSDSVSISLPSHAYCTDELAPVGLRNELGTARGVFLTRAITAHGSNVP